MDIHEDRINEYRPEEIKKSTINGMQLDRAASQ